MAMPPTGTWRPAMIRPGIVVSVSGAGAPTRRGSSRPSTPGTPDRAIRRPWPAALGLRCDSWSPPNPDHLRDSAVAGMGQGGARAIVRIEDRAIGEHHDGMRARHAGRDLDARDV